MHGGIIWYRDTRVLHGIAAVLHAIQAVVVLGLASWLNTTPDTQNHGVFALTRQVAVWTPVNSAAVNASQHSMSMVGNYSIVQTFIDSGSLDVRYAILAFFCLASIDHACVALSPMIWEVELLAGQLRYVEYSISASIMSICIAVEMGITDLYVLITIFVLMFATQILGMMADLVSNPDGSMYWSPIQSIMGLYVWIIPHFAGWITCIAAYMPILDAFVSSSKWSSIQAPDFVKAIVFSQFFLFVSFGFVQTYQLWTRSSILSKNDRPYMHVDLQQQHVDLDLKSLNRTTERLFITLSLVAKTLLAWLIMAPILTAAM